MFQQTNFQYRYIVVAELWNVDEEATKRTLSIRFGNVGDCVDDDEARNIFCGLRGDDMVYFVRFFERLSPDSTEKNRRRAARIKKSEQQSDVKR